MVIVVLWMSSTGLADEGMPGTEAMELELPDARTVDAASPCPCEEDKPRPLEGMLSLTPVWDTWISVQIGEPLRWTIDTIATGGQDVYLAEGTGSSEWGLEFEAIGLPPGARFDPERRRLEWSPEAGDIGDHTFELVVRNARGEDRTTLEIEVVDEWERYFVPGVSAVAYRPSYGEAVYLGVGLEYLIGTWAYRNGGPAPSHGRVYVDLELMGDQDGDSIVAYGLGGAVSFESNANRTFLIPHFGVEASGLTRRDHGTRFLVTPLLSLHLWSREHAAIHLDAGWSVPLASWSTDSGYTGLRAGIGLNLAPF